MKYTIPAALLLISLGGCHVLTYGEAGADPAIPKKLVIIHSTDTHSKYLPFWMEPNFFDREMGLQSRFPACWDLDWGGGASYCNGNYDAERDAYRVWENGVYLYRSRAGATPGTWLEDINHDGVCDVKDCQRCWDRNRNNICDPNEDVDDQLGCDVGDCEAQPEDKRVFYCWDSDLPSDPEALAGYQPQCDPWDDTNRDHICGFADCAPVWDRNHDFRCNHPYDRQYGTYLADDGAPILRRSFADDLAFAAAYNSARQNSEDNNKDGTCSHGDYRPGLIDTGGVARVATLQKRLMAKHQGVPVLRFDSGDVSQGAPQYNLYRGDLEMLTIQKLGMDAMAIGNHEFDNGASRFSTAYRRAGGFALLAANYIFDEEDDKGMRAITAPYYIFRRGKLTIGVVGLGNDSSLTSMYNVSGSLGFNAYEPKEIAQRYVDILRSQCDLVILLTHQGLEGDFELAERVSGVDLILGGHHHVILDPIKVMHGPDGREVLVVHSGVNYKVLAELELAVANKRVVWHRYTTHAITDAIPEDPDMNAMLYPYIQGLAYAQDLNKIVGHATSTIKRTDPNGGDSPLGNILTDAMIQHELSRAQFAMTNSLGIRADIPTGDISYSKLYEVFPFENTIVTMYLSGKEVKELFDYVARRSSTRGCKTQVQVSGMRVVLDCSPPLELTQRFNSFALTEYLAIGSNVIVEDYELTQPNMVFKMATNDYVGRGGSGFDMLERNTTRLDTSVSLRDAVVEFFEREGDLDPMDFTSGLGGEPKRIEMRN